MEGDAGTSQLNPTDAERRAGRVGSSTEREQISADRQRSSRDVAGRRAEQPTCEAGVAVRDRRPRHGSSAVCAAPAAAGRGGGASVATSRCASTTRARPSRATMRPPWQRAKDCVTATQAPDTAAMTASQAKIIECSTGDFGAQATLYSGMLVEAYQAANVKVQVSDMRAAVEKHNDDGSVDVLVAVRVKVTNSQAADQEQGYRLRVKMAPARRHVQDRQAATRSRRDGGARRRRRTRPPTTRRRVRLAARRGGRGRAPSRWTCCSASA